MINPNVAYKQKTIGVVTHIDAENSYIPYIKVSLDGRFYEGDLKRCHSQWQKIKVGDQVRISLQWSITSDKAMIKAVARVRTPKPKYVARVHSWNPNGTNDIEILDRNGEVMDTLCEALFGVDTGTSDYIELGIKSCLNSIAVSPVNTGLDTYNLLNQYI